MSHIIQVGFTFGLLFVFSTVALATEESGDLVSNLGTMILAIGALGTASFGIIDGLKWIGLGLFGFGQIPKLLGSPVMKALEIAHGPQYMKMLKGQYLANRTSGDLPKSIRQGARVGLTPETAVALAEEIGVVGATDLKAVAASLQKGKALTDNQRGVLGRYELALDTRIDAALALANDHYVNYMRFFASLVAIAIAFGVRQYTRGDILTTLIIGFTAVPLAPIAKDLATAIQSAAKAMRQKK